MQSFQKTQAQSVKNLNILGTKSVKIDLIDSNPIESSDNSFSEQSLEQSNSKNDMVFEDDTFIGIGYIQELLADHSIEYAQESLSPLLNPIKEFDVNSEDDQNIDQLTQDKLEDLIPQYPSLKGVLSMRYKLLKAENNHAMSQIIIQKDATITENKEITNQKMMLFNSGIIKKVADFGKLNFPNKITPEQELKKEKEKEEENQQDMEKQLIDDLRSKYCETSLNHFGFDNKIRRFCINIFHSKWFDNVIIFFITINSIMLGLFDYTWDRKENKQSEIPAMNVLVEQSEVFFTTVFTMEAVIKIMAQGFILHKNSYLYDAWNWLDFTVVVTSLAQKLPFVQNMQILRTFRLFRPLKSLSNLPSMKLMVSTLFNSLNPLATILILDAFFILVFAVTGNAMWEGVMHYRCRQTKYPENGDWKVVEGDERICGAFHMCEIACGSLYELENHNDHLHALNKNIPLDRDSKNAFQNFGITNFDDLGSSYLTIFQCITLEGWTKIKQMIEDGFDPYVSSIFFTLLVIICTYFLLNMTIAIMLVQFKKIKKHLQMKEEKEKAGNQKGNNREQLMKDLHLKRVESQQAMMQLLNLKKNMTTKQKLMNLFANLVYSDPGETPDVSLYPRYKLSLCRICWKIQTIPLFNTSVMTLIIANIIILATEQYPSPKEDLIVQSNKFFTILFTAESVIKIIGLTLREWRQDIFNILDLAIVLFSYIEMYVSQNDTAIIGAFRSVRLFRLFKLARSNFTLRTLIDSIAVTMAQCANFIVILMIFIYVFSLLGMEFFAEQFKFNQNGIYDKENGTVPRQNYDHIFDAIMSTFQIMVGEKWNEIMYLGHQANKNTAVIYFMLVVVLGRIILLNLFLAILLGQYESASLEIREEQEERILNQFKESTSSLTNERQINIGEGFSAFRMNLEPVPQNRGSQEIGSGNVMINSQINTMQESELNSAKNHRRRSQIDSSFDSSVDLKAEYLKEHPSKERLETSSFKKNISQIESVSGSWESSEKKDNQSRPNFHKTESGTNKINNLENESEDQEGLDSARNFNSHRALMLMKQKSSISGKSIESRKHRQLKLNLKDLSSVEFDGSPPQNIDLTTDSAERKLFSFQKVISHIFESSLFVLHKDSAIRKFLIKLTTARVNQSQNKSILNKIQNLGNDDSEEEDEIEDGGHQSINKKSPEELSPISYITDKIIYREDMDTKFLIKKQRSLMSPMMRKQQIVNVENEASLMSQSVRKIKGSIKFLNWSLNRWFENGIYLLILLSLILLIIDNPMNDPNSQISKNISQFEVFITILFTCEAVLRIMALGFFSCSIPGRSAYIQLGRNKIDFLVCVSSILLVVYDSPLISDDMKLVNQGTLKSFKVLRSIRAIRLLRIISQNQGLQLAVISVLSSLNAILNGSIVCALIVLIYAIIGLSIFKGKFYHCVFIWEGADTQANVELLRGVETKYECVNLGGYWEKYPYNFDNIGSAASLLFQIITTEGWLDVMYNGMDIKGIGFQAKQNDNQIVSMYFVSFIVIGKIFILNLFVGIVIDNYNRNKEKMKGYSLMSKDQKEWVEAEKQMIRIELIKAKTVPKQSLLRKAFKLHQMKHFGRFIDFTIIICAITQGLHHFKMDIDFRNGLRYSHLTCCIIFNLETIIQVMSIRFDYPSLYSTELIVILANDIALIIDFYTPIEQQDHNVTQMISNAMKALIILRLLKILKQFKSLRVKLECLNAIFRQCANLLSLILLMFWIFAIIGLNTFSFVKHQVEINENNNFSSFGNAMELLFRCATGEKWNMIMRELAMSKQTILKNLQIPIDHSFSHQSKQKSIECIQDQTFESLQQNGPQQCGSLEVSFVYFFTFIIVINIMMFNLLMATIIDAFQTANKELTGAINFDHHNNFIESWVKFDPKGTGWIYLEDVIFLVCDVKEPLGKKNFYETEVKEQMVIKLDHIKAKSKNDRLKRFIVHSEQEMVIPFIMALQIINEMHLPVYDNGMGTFQCHFRDVIKRLGRQVLERKHTNYNPKGIELKQLKILERSWNNKYPNLKKRKAMQGFDSGRLFASQFIVQSMELVHNIRKYDKQENVEQKLNLITTEKKDGHSKIAIPLNQKGQTQAAKEEDEKKLTMAEESLKGYFQEILTIQRRKMQRDESNKHLTKSRLSTSLQPQIERQMTSQFAQEQDVTKLKDYQRSTWWMADDDKNYKMRQWQKNQDFKKYIVHSQKQEKKAKKIHKVQSLNLTEFGQSMEQRKENLQDAQQRGTLMIKKFPENID